MKFSNADGENLVQANIADDVFRFGNGVGDFVLVFSMIHDSAIQFGNGLVILCGQASSMAAAPSSLVVAPAILWWRASL